MATNKNNQTMKSQKGQQVPEFTEEQAREYFEKLRWPDGPVCVHCGSVNVTRLNGEAHRKGAIQCNDCREQFTVTLKSIMEDTHLTLATWAKAFHLMCSAKKGISALQLQRQLGLGSYRTAWHLCHRIREAMRCEPVKGMLKGVVESDEAWIGGKPRRVNNGRYKGNGRQGLTPKQPVHTLVQRDGKKITRVIAAVTAKNLKANIDAITNKAESTLMTDQHVAYKTIGRSFKNGHKTVDHGVYEYARKADGAHINTAESSHALIKRGIIGSFHHVSKEHLQRYLDEFDFRWNARETTDVERRELAIKGGEGKRLMYKNPIIERNNAAEGI